MLVLLEESGTYYFADVLGYGLADLFPDLGSGLSLKEALSSLGSNMFRNYIVGLTLGIDVSA